MSLLKNKLHITNIQHFNIQIYVSSNVMKSIKFKLIF